MRGCWWKEGGGGGGVQVQSGGPLSSMYCFYVVLVKLMQFRDRIEREMCMYDQYEMIETLTWHTFFGVLWSLLYQQHPKHNPNLYQLLLLLLKDRGEEKRGLGFRFWVEFFKSNISSFNVCFIHHTNNTEEVSCTKGLFAPTLTLTS